MTTIGEELERMSAAAPPPPLSTPGPRDFAPGVTYEGGRPATITTPALPHLADEDDWTHAVQQMGIPVPEGYRLRLTEARFDPGAWQRDNDGEDAVTRAMWRYRFVVEPVPLGWVEDVDLAALHRGSEAFK